MNWDGSGSNHRKLFDTVRYPSSDTDQIPDETQNNRISNEDRQRHIYIILGRGYKQDKVQNSRCLGLYQAPGPPDKEAKLVPTWCSTAIQKAFEYEKCVLDNIKMCLKETGGD